MTISRKQYEALLAELATLDALMESTPESATIDRMSLEYRKSDVRSELESNPPPARWPASVRLTFGGEPVSDDRGILADFGSHALKAFADAVASFGASQRGPLNNVGAIPNREDFNLLITGTGPGSFAFDIEEASAQDMLIPDNSAVETGIDLIKSMLESSVSNDEELAELVVDAHPRALTDLREFLQIMASNRAVCSLSFRDDLFRFSDVGQVQQSLARLSTDNINEEIVEMVGYFQGYLPNSRRAEFVVVEMDRVLSCRVDPLVIHADAINAMLNHTVMARFRSTQVGTARPRYTVLGYGQDTDALTTHES